FAKITRKRALMMMQQQYQQQSMTTELSSKVHSNINHNTPIYRNAGIHDPKLISVPTPGASDTERESSPNKRTRVDAS
ncbi:9504_t:CDS:1, partial [Acaulospora morrowiae]